MNEILGNIALWPAEQLFNSLVLADTHAKEKFKPFAEKSLQIITSSPALPIRVSFELGSIRLHAIDSEKFSLPVEATICGATQNLLSLLVSESSEQALVSDEISITGDVQFVQDIFTAMKTLDLDWQDILTPILGDVGTHELDQTVSSTTAWAKDSRKRLHRSMDDYLKEENNLFPPRQQLDSFADDLDLLRLNIDRLHARASRIKAQLDRLEN